MFREMLRKKRGISEEECIDILKKEPRGVLSVLGDDDYPYGMPMNHYFNEEDGCIYFHCGKNGHRLDAIRKHDKVSFCVYDEGYRENGDWALHIKSVIVFGKLKVMDDMETIVDISTKLSHKFTQDEAFIQKEIDLYAKETFLLKLTPEHMCGKKVKES